MRRGFLVAGAIILVVGIIFIPISQTIEGYEIIGEYYGFDGRAIDFTTYLRSARTYIIDIHGPIGFPQGYMGEGDPNTKIIGPTGSWELSGYSDLRFSPPVSGNYRVALMIWEAGDVSGGEDTFAVVKEVVAGKNLISPLLLYSGLSLILLGAIVVIVGSISKKS